MKGMGGKRSRPSSKEQSQHPPRDGRGKTMENCRPGLAIPPKPTKSSKCTQFTALHLNDHSYCACLIGLELQTASPGLEELVMAIISPIFRSLNCLAILCDSVNQDIFSANFFRKYIFPPYFKILFKDNEDLLSPNYNTLKVIRQIRHDGCQAYIIFLSNGGQLSRLLRFGDKYRVLNTRAKFVLLHDFRLFRPELHTLWKKFVNIVFLRRFGGYRRTAITGRRQMVPWYEITTVPFPTPIRGILIPKRLDTWRQGKFHSGVDLFREKISNLRRQIFQIVTFEHLPSAVKNISTAVKETSGFGGLEIEVLHTIASKINFKPYLYETSNADEEKWGREQLNGSFTGLLGEVVSGRAEIVLGNLYYTPYHLELMDLSIPYNTECLTFLTPELLTDNSWKTLILPFKPYMWVAVIVTLFLGGFIFLALSSFHQWIESPANRNHNEDTGDNKTHAMEPNTAADSTTTEGLYLFGELSNAILYTFGMLLLVSLPKLPSGWSLRLLTGWWWLYCVLVVVAYRASMTAILANPAPRVTIDTLDELTESHIACGGWGEQQKEFFLTSLDAAGQKIGQKFEVIYDDDAAIEKVAMGEFAYYGNIHFLRHARVKRQLSMKAGSKDNNNTQVAAGSNDTEERRLHIMNDCVINMPISLGLQKNSPLKPRIDLFLRKIIEAGLVQKWLTEVMLPTVAQEPLLQQEDSTTALMDMRKLYGGLVALGIGYFLSLCVLAAELLHWQCVVKKNPLFDKYAVHMYYNRQKKEKLNIRR